MLYLRLKNATAHTRRGLAALGVSVVLAGAVIDCAFAADVASMRDGETRGTIASDQNSVEDSINGTLEQLRNVEAPAWPNPLAAGNQGFCRALEAITGKPPADDLKQFFSGVIKIERSGAGIRLYREDNQTIEIQPGTEFGDRLLTGIDRASQKATKKFGKPVGDLIAGLASVGLDGNKITVQRTGANVVPIVVQKQKQEKRYWIKELRLDEMSFEVRDRNGQPAIENVAGFAAVLDTMSIPLQLREFAQTVNKRAEKVYLIGIKNPLPRTITSLLGLGDVLHLHFAEHVQGKNKKVETEESELDQAERAAGSTVTTTSGTAVDQEQEVAPTPFPAVAAPQACSSAAPNAAAQPAAGTSAPSSVAQPAAGTSAPSPVAQPAAGTSAPSPVAQPAAGTSAPSPVAQPAAGTSAPSPVAQPAAGTSAPRSGEGLQPRQ